MREVVWSVFSVEEVLLESLAVLFSLQQLVGQGQQLGYHPVEVLAVAEQVQAQL